MARYIKLETPEGGVYDGMQLTFVAPCDCSDVIGIELDGIDYTLVDASGSSLTSCSKYFSKGEMLTVIIDGNNEHAMLLNARVNTYTKSLGTIDDAPSSVGTTVWARVKQLENDMEAHAPNDHTHTKRDITDFAHNHDERYYTEGEMDAKLKDHTHTKEQIVDFPESMPASDVYSWAKEPIKPSYTPSEVGASPANHTHNEITTLENWKSQTESGTPVPQANKIVEGYTAFTDADMKTFTPNNRVYVFVFTAEDRYSLTTTVLMPISGYYDNQRSAECARGEYIVYNPSAANKLTFYTMSNVSYSPSQIWYREI